MKKCPYCAEEIQDEAIYCRYCKHDLEDNSKIDTNGQHSSLFEQNKERKIIPDLEESKTGTKFQNYSEQGNRQTRNGGKPLLLISFYVYIVVFVIITIIPTAYELLTGIITWDFVPLMFQHDYYQEIIAEASAAVFSVYVWRTLNERGIKVIPKWIIAILAYLFTAFFILAIFEEVLG